MLRVNTSYLTKESFLFLQENKKIQSSIIWTLSSPSGRSSWPSSRRISLYIPLLLLVNMKLRLWLLVLNFRFLILSSKARVLALAFAIRLFWKIIKDKCQVHCYEFQAKVCKGGSYLTQFTSLSTYWEDWVRVNPLQASNHPHTLLYKVDTNLEHKT